MTTLDQALRQCAGRPLLGVAALTYNPAFVEIAAHLGFKVLWVEMEHTFLTFREAADLCRMASGMGLLTMIRIPDASRENVLKAAECGPDILDIPMANSAEVLQDLVRHARFPPLGERGFFSVSRAVHYGLAEPVPEEQQRINRELCLMAQVETMTAVERAEELCQVPEVGALFLGPGDLSASLGVPGQTGHPKVLEAAARVIATARRHGKLIATAAPPPDFEFYISQGIDLLFCGHELGCLKSGAEALLEQARAAMERT